jgi:hypothetical protein
MKLMEKEHGRKEGDKGTNGMKGKQEEGRGNDNTDR